MFRGTRKGTTKYCFKGQTFHQVGGYKYEGRKHNYKSPGWALLAWFIQICHASVSTTVCCPGSCLSYRFAQFRLCKSCLKHCLDCFDRKPSINSKGDYNTNYAIYRFGEEKKKKEKKGIFLPVWKTSGMRTIIIRAEAILTSTFLMKALTAVPKSSNIKFGGSSLSPFKVTRCDYQKPSTISGMKWRQLLLETYMQARQSRLQLARSYMF